MCGSNELCILSLDKLSSGLGFKVTTLNVLLLSKIKNISLMYYRIDQKSFKRILPFTNPIVSLKKFSTSLYLREINEQLIHLSMGESDKYSTNF